MAITVSHMTAIETHGLGPTDSKGSRIVATAGDSARITIPYRHNLSAEENHKAAAEALVAEMGWSGDMVAGTTARGMVFVFVS